MTVGIMALEILTPEQVADYLQLRVDTIYRYIRAGKLAANRFGRTYRIPRQSLDLFLVETSTREDVRDALFARVMAVAETGPRVPVDEVERDVAEAVAHARRAGRGD